jgi:hypothetical protein
VAHTISFRRPELRHVLSTMFVPPEADVMAQIRHLQDLGYQIIDVTPPLDGSAPQPPKLSVVDDPASWFRRYARGRENRSTQLPQHTSNGRTKRNMIMMSVKTIALSGASFAILLLAAGSAAAAQPDSSPAEQAQTQQLNQNITNANAAADAQSIEQNAVYKAQQERYREQLRVYRAGQQNYEERATAYLAARDRYVAGHAQYHRAAWPSRFNQRLIIDTNDLLGSSVHTADGRTVGHVQEIALTTGRVSALRVTLDNNRGDVWIESDDLRFNADKKVVMTNLDRRDLYVMTHETY